MTKLVSVVVATYRRDRELKKALCSLAEQSYRNLEIILVDDNGNAEWNGKVSAIVDEIRFLFPEISLKHIVNDQQQGSAKTRNIGIAASDGEYVTFLDDDDIYLSDKVTNQLCFMEAGGYDYSVTDLVLYREDEKKTDCRIRSYIKDTSAAALTKYHLKYHITGTDTMMFRRDYLEKIGGFAAVDVGDEYYLMQRAIDGGGVFGYLPRCDVKAYVHTGENGLSSGDSKIEGENRLFEYKQQFFSELDAETRNYICMRHYAVLAYAELRRGRLVSSFHYAVKSFLSDPQRCMELFLMERK